MSHTHRIVIKSSRVPTVEIDTTVSAAYIRFSKSKVVKTISEDKPGVIVAIDLDCNGDVVGIELIGVKEFNVHTLIRLAAVKAPNIDFSRARYVRAGQAELAED